MRNPFILSFLAVAATTSAVVIRHDVEDQLYKDLASQTQYACVGRIDSTEDDDSFIASGVYIGAHNGSAWLLTAAHNNLGAASAATVKFGEDTYTLDRTSWLDYSGGSLVPGKNDLALIKILDLENAPTAARFVSSKLVIGAAGANKPIGTSVGFGKSGNGNTGWAGDPGIKRGFKNRLEFVDLHIDAGENSVDYWGYWSDFDNGAASGNQLNIPPLIVSSAAQLDLEGITAPGDSGGGLFAIKDGAERLVGITSTSSPGIGGVDGAYGSKTRWTAITATSSAWITQRTGIAAVPEPNAFFALGFGIVSLMRRKFRR
ncbi:MAG: hypothetical protein IT205_09745 [Fimbriimonadaceae bacterium]|nr:hypothetical protein [Fimbriimonadaceae bacterium]